MIEYILLKLNFIKSLLCKKLNIYNKEKNKVNNKKKNNMSQNVFVSPGVYTSEKRHFIHTRQVGVTALGLVGETTIGPAFQPIFITNYGEFQSFFGGLNATKRYWCSTI
jgi:hypothetical protein